MRKPPNPCVRLGRTDYHNSKEREGNPFAKDSADYKAWDRGWMAAHREANR
jgi:hypothetical protein